MVNAQEWLDRNYPCDCRRGLWTSNDLIHKKNCPRKNLSELNLRNLNLVGDLDLGTFFDLKKIYLAGNPQLGEIKNKDYWTLTTYQSPQKFLNHYYSNKNQVKTINFNGNLGFEQPDELVINNYPNLKEIKKETFQETFQIIKVTISNCPRLEKVNIWMFRDNQELILKNLPSLKEIECWENQLTNLNLVHFPQLKKLDCSDNKLTTLDLTNLSGLQTINCWNNLLTKIKLPFSVREELEELVLSDNNFPERDLSIFSHLVNLKGLELGNKHDQENCFTGSLEPLRNLSELKMLDISNTDIDSGLEYLPDSVEIFYCSADERKNAKCRCIYDLFSSERGEIETEYEKIKNFLKNLKNTNNEENLTLLKNKSSSE